MWLFPKLWRDLTTGRMYVQTRVFSPTYGQWQEVKRIIGPLWVAEKYPPFRDNTCNFVRT